MPDRNASLRTQPIGNEEDFERALRPTSLDEFVGQQKIKDNLRVFMEAALRREETLDHVLLSGPPGLGKTTLAHIIATEMRANIKTTSGPVLDKPASIAGVLTNLDEGDILFIDEIHRIPKTVEEYLYSAMEDFRIDVPLDTGTVVLGEVGLGGEVRSVSRLEARLSEVARLGFERVVVPAAGSKSVHAAGGLEVQRVHSLQEAMGYLI